MWGVKCQSCSERNNVNAVICEILTTHYIAQCEDKHFTCNDGSCILLLYVCDYIADCFNDSDEDKCDGVVNNRVSCVALPCDFGILCNTHKRSFIPIHSICDGIYSNTTIPQEKEACWQGKIQHIHLLDLMFLELINPQATEMSKCRTRQMLKHKYQDVIYS